MPKAFVMIAGFILQKQPIKDICSNPASYILNVFQKSSQDSFNKILSYLDLHSMEKTWGTLHVPISSEENFKGSTYCRISEFLFTISMKER
jgi:hypothetical protein